MSEARVERLAEMANVVATGAALCETEVIAGVMAKVVRQYGLPGLYAVSCAFADEVAKTPQEKLAPATGVWGALSERQQRAVDWASDFVDARRSRAQDRSLELFAAQTDETQLMEAVSALIGCLGVVLRERVLGIGEDDG